MRLCDFEVELSSIPPPPRNDRGDCERRLLGVFLALGHDRETASQQARHLALALDLWPSTDSSRPLYMWIDDRETPRYPDRGLPYDIGLASFLVPSVDGTYVFSIWEYAERNNLINLLMHHIDLPAPVSQQTTFDTLLAAEPPSHKLYQHLRFVPFRYNPDTLEGIEAFQGPPDISAQSRFLKKTFKIDPAPGR